jgi:uncharacterized surface protein with fasciclin (FAS1) repeats
MSETIIEAIKTSPHHETILKAIAYTDILHRLNNDDEVFTLFAPVEAAFTYFDSRELEELFKIDNNQDLVYLLSHHIVEGFLDTIKLRQMHGLSLKTLAGDFISVQVKNQDVIFADCSRLIPPEIKASNGVVYSLDRLMLEPA